MTSLTATGDDRNLVASHPVIALMFHILPPLFVSRVKPLDELEPVKIKNKTQSLYLPAVSVTSPTGHSMTFRVHLRLTRFPSRLGGRWAWPRECVCRGFFLGWMCLWMKSPFYEWIDHSVVTIELLEWGFTFPIYFRVDSGKQISKVGSMILTTE